MPSELDAASDQDDNGESTEASGRLEGHITSAELLNPSDALDLLAQVANLDPQGQGQSQGHAEATNHDTTTATRSVEAGTTQSIADYPPIASGALSISDAASLLQEYVAPTRG
jgi:hypothetical protein